MFQLRSPYHCEDLNTFSKFLPNPPLLCSENCGWHGLHLQYHHQPAWEIPWQSSPHHLILISHGRKTIATEWLSSKEFIWHQPIAAGDIVVIPADREYKTIWHDNSDFLLLMLDPSQVNELAKASITNRSIEIIPHFLSPAPLIYQIGLSLKAELELNRVYSQEYARVLLPVLAANITKKISQQILEDAELTSGLSRYRLQQAIQYIHNNLTENISFKTVANEVQISPYHFARLFKEVMGLSVHQYLLHCRIEKAKQLLIQTDLKIIDIAQLTGFHTSSHFTNVFHKHIGRSPLQYKKEHKSKIL